MKTNLKICFTMIIFNGDDVLEETLQQIYPYAHQILINEGCVQFFADKGFKGSTDRTNEILSNFPDPENKITVSHGVYSEKTEQSNVLMSSLDPQTDFIWMIDSDEVYSIENIEKIIKFLEQEMPFSVGVHSKTFFGGFDHYVSGFEEQTDNFLRIFRASPGCYYHGHRPPGLFHPARKPTGRHVSSKELLDKTGAFFHHYSYTFPEKVKNKIEYYRARVSMNNCIENYFEKVWVPWVKFPEHREGIEYLFNGVHEFIHRPPAFTKKFEGKHPESIERNMDKLCKKWMEQWNKLGLNV